eukprot:TRINITY_DN20497_c0_g1_i1.p1 TRINITY_DN20497_c0_g1~~TRINITY_DN20497_c0_g1_i1.p1  ORF type:complete len:231 (+),score=27.95 TRINITY_DN20497_c0_g1_i1:137-829(+)
MAFSADFRVSAALVPYRAHPFQPSIAPSKVGFSGLFTRGSDILETKPKWPCIGSEGHKTRQHLPMCFGITREKLSPKTISREAEGFLLDAINMSFLERLSLAWKMLFPPTFVRRSSNAKIAKQRLKMILFSDRCAVSDEAKRLIVSNIVGALSNFVEIDSQDKVQLNVSTDPNLGTMYSVTVPVRRVKAEYQDYDGDYSGITNIEYKDTGEGSGSVDVTFDFYIPNEKNQ